jgi:MtN3 and saliva related transmembrane protein
MSFEQIFGYIGCSLLVMTLIPQIYTNYKSKTMKDVSIVFILLQNLTCISFLIYGSLLKESPLIIANSIVEFQCLILLAMKLVYDKDKESTVLLPIIPVNKLYICSV